MNLTEKVKELVVALNSSVYMPYENIIISAHDMHGDTHVEYCHADPSVAIAHVCVLMETIAEMLHLGRKDVAKLIAKAYIMGGNDFDKQADKGDDRWNTGTPAGDRE